MAFNYNPEAEDNRSVWKWLPHLTHRHIEEALQKNQAVKDGLAKLTASPDDAPARSELVNVIARRTGNCIGQAALGRPLDPEDDSKSAYKALPSGSEAEIAQAISDDAKVKGDPVSDILRMTSRFTGNCIGERAFALSTHV